MPFGWIQEKIDWTDAAHIWNQDKILRLQERGEYTSIFATSLWGPFGTKQIHGLLLDSDCDNVTYPGSIGYNQEFCEPDSDPDEIVSLTPAGGGSGEIEYIWLIKVGNGEWETIPGSTGASYDPGPLSQPTFFRRCARRSGCEEYIETDIVHITFLIPSLLESSKECVEGESGKYQVDLNPGNVNQVTANGEIIYPPYIVQADSGEVIQVVATGDCGTIERTITDEGVDYSLCEGEEPCVAPVITISGTPVCNADNESYTVDFTVTDADSVFVNDVLVTETGPDFSISVPQGQNASIRAINDCDSDNRSVEAPICDDLCPVTITIPTDGNPVCNDDNETYTVTFMIEGADSVFVNEVFYAPTSGNTYTLTFPRGVRTCIFAWKYNEDGSPLCRANREIDAPPCCDDPDPSIPSIVTECNDDNETYTLTATVLDADEVRVNGELVSPDATDSTKYVVVLAIGVRAEIEAITECDGQKLRAFRSAESPVCNCPKPEIEITEQLCDADGQNYTISFTVMGADSVYLNGELLAGTGPDFSGSLPTAEDAMIRAVKDCGDVQAEATATAPAPCCLPTPTIVINEKFCSSDSTDFTLTFTVTDADEVFVNDVLQTEAGPQYTVTLPASDTARILVKNECAQASRQEVAICCPQPEIGISFEDNPACNPDGETYTLEFTVTGAVSVSVNEVELDGEGPNYSITLPNGTRACIVATADCGNRATREVEAPEECPPCPTPTVNITVDDTNPICNPGDTTYQITFTVSNMPDSVFVNGVLVTSEDSTFSIDVPIDQQAVIRAVKICGELSAEDSKTIDPPTCPPCPTPTVNITVDDTNPICNPGDTTYQITFTVSNMPDSVFVNGELVTSEDSTFSIDVPIDQQAVIRAVKICGELSAEDSKTIDPPTCPPCPTPTVNITVDDTNPICNPGDTTYQITFTVSNMPDSVFVNGELVTSEDSTFSIDVPIDQQAVIRAVKICGELSAEDSKTIDPPTCPPCPTPTVNITVDDTNPICNPGDTTYQITFTVSNMPDSVFVNGELVTSEDSTFSIDVPIDQQAVIRAVKICGELSAEDSKTIDPPTCPPCPTPTVNITVDDTNPICNPGDTTYQITFTVSNMPDSVFVNGELVTSEDSTFSIDVPIDQQAVIRAVKICGELSAEDSKTIDPPTCPPCPTPTVNITVDDTNPICNPGDTTYQITFTVSNMPDSVFVNGELVTSEDSTFSIDVPIDQQAVIRAVKICGELSAEDSKTIDPPTCPPCPTPTVNITVDDTNPICNPGDTTYQITFTVSNMPDSVFVNGELVTSEDSTFSIDVPIDQQAVIRAVKICGELSAEDSKTIDPPTCPPCPTPTVNITVDDTNPICNPGDTTYQITFTVSNMPDSVFVNGELVTSEDSTFSIDVPIDQQAVIRAVKICGELSAEDSKTIDPPTCPPCPTPTVNITVDDTNPICNPGDTTYQITFTVSNMPDSVFVNGELVTSEDSTFSIDVPIDQQAVIRAVKICGELSAEDSKTIDPPTCPPVVCPMVELGDVCAEIGTTATLVPNITGGTEPFGFQWFNNADLQGDPISTDSTLDVTEMGTYYVVITDQDSTCAPAIDSALVEFIAAPVITLIDKVCAEDGLSYTLTFSVTNAVSVSINGEGLGGGPQYSIVLPINQVAEIVASNNCSTISLDANLSVTPPDCPTCPMVELGDICAEIGTTATLVPNITGGTEPFGFQWFNNADLQGDPIGTDSTLDVTADGTYYVVITDQDTTCAPAIDSALVEFIVAPVITLIDKVCNEDGLSYTLTFSVTDAVTVSVNGQELDGGPEYSVVLPIDQTANIVASNNCSTLTLDANLSVTPPDCPTCPTVELGDVCAEIGTTATLVPNITRRNRTIWLPVVQ